MKGKAIVLGMVLLLIVPVFNFNSSGKETNEKYTMEIYDMYGNKIEERKISLAMLHSLEEKIKKGELDDLGIKWDFGFSNWIISYGKGKVYIPLSRERSFFRLLFRPIFFDYQEGFTMVKFGANYFWKGKSMGDYGIMLRNQQGMMLGFFGIHIRIRHPLQPDTHIFIGTNLLMIGRDKIL